MKLLTILTLLTLLTLIGCDKGKSEQPISKVDSKIETNEIWDEKSSFDYPKDILFLEAHHYSTLYQKNVSNVKLDTVLIRKWERWETVENVYGISQGKEYDNELSSNRSHIRKLIDPDTLIGKTIELYYIDVFGKKGNVTDRHYFALNIIDPIAP